MGREPLYPHGGVASPERDGQPHADKSSLVPRSSSIEGSGNETEWIYAVVSFPLIHAHSSAPLRYKKRHIALKIAYLGWDYSGLAIQDTVENTIEVREPIPF